MRTLAFIVFLYHLFIGLLLACSMLLSGMLIFGSEIALQSTLQQEQKWFASTFAGSLGVLFCSIILLFALLHFFCAYGLWRKRRWAKGLAAVLAIVHILNIPLGTGIAFATYFLFFGKNATYHQGFLEGDSDVIPASENGIGCGLFLFMCGAAAVVLGFFYFSRAMSVFLEDFNSENTSSTSIFTEDLKSQNQFKMLKKRIQKLRPSTAHLANQVGEDGLIHDEETSSDNAQEESVVLEKARKTLEVNSETKLEKISRKKLKPKSEKEEKGTWRFVDDKKAVHFVDHYLKIPIRYRFSAEKLEF